MSIVQIESREQLMAALGEAAEIEHNLMCCYLYAMFSLKDSTDEELSDAELVAVRKWRRVILGVALEEMTHLTLVANLTAALGGTPHFGRPNFPVSPGMYPAGVVIELAPFDLDTLDHFIYLERPVASALSDGQGFTASSYRRRVDRSRLMPFGGDYATVGELYAAIGEGLRYLSGTLGADVLFCGDRSLQVRPTDTALPGLVAVACLDSALAALDTIVVQGEGSVTSGDSHFARFQTIRREYQALLEARPSFAPARRAARNPLMRPPIVATGRLHITAEPAASLIDLANASYVQMLRLLLQAWAVPQRPAADKRALLKSGVLMMRALAQIGSRLSQLPASESAPGCTAGVSFATIRALSPLQGGTIERAVLGERNRQLLEAVRRLAAEDHALIAAGEALEAAHALLADIGIGSAAPPPAAMSSPARPAASATASGPAAADPMASPAAAIASDGIERASGTAIDIAFDGKRCIHSRHCVLNLPQVFLANTPGTWIKPDETRPETLVSVAENCPSGAIRYQRHDGGPQEAPPRVNTLHVRENGPLAVRAPIALNGAAIGYRATLCRCGRSSNKPFCDGSHVGAFVASGEPATGDATALAIRDGVLAVDPEPNGPLAVRGNLEICAGTGRTVARVTETRLCRCGGSRNKPFCDSSHLVNGFTAD